jgi:predicted DNA-binding transcriptional regulator AlpA
LNRGHRNLLFRVIEMSNAPSPDHLPKSLHARQWADALQRLEDVRKPHLTTREAAYYTGKAISTLHYWAMTGEGLVQPLRIGKRLAWPTAEVKRVLGLAD